MAKGSIPVLVGVGQAVSHWDGTNGAADAPSFISLAVEAAKRALADAGGHADLAGAIDTVAMMRTMDDCIPGFPHPFGRADNLPRAVAGGIGADPADAIYAVEGGQGPQQLVNEMSARIHAGECDVALIAGTEAIGARKAAKRAGLTLDFSAEVGGQLDERMPAESLLSRTEIKHGLITPAFFYALLENAYAHKSGRGRAAHRAVMGELFTGFAAVAETNPYSQFPVARSAEFLATPSKANYPFADPYLKWMMAQDAVNMAAAVLVMSSEKADEMGVPEASRVYLHGGGEAADIHISERPRLDGSWAMETALGAAFQHAEKRPEDMQLLDLYSCFPIAVFSSTDVLDLDWRTDPRALTQTGGLPFFGGPGNNYSLHGIASMVENLRQQPGAFGLVLANGGWMTKEAAGIYSTERPETFTPVTPMATASERLEIQPEPGKGRLETFTLVHGRSGPGQAIVLGRTGNDARFVAVSRDAGVLARLSHDDLPIGAELTIMTEGEVNTFQFA